MGDITMSILIVLKVEVDGHSDDTHPEKQIKIMEHFNHIDNTTELCCHEDFINNKDQTSFSFTFCWN